MFKKLNIFLLSFLLPLSIAIAADVDLSWTAPTLNEDGSLIATTCATDPGTCLAGFKIYYGTTSGVYDLGPDNIVDPLAVTHTVTGLNNNTTYYFVATAYNVAGEESTYSGEATKVIGPVVPGPPLNLTVVDSIAYTYSISKDKVVMVPVGTVPTGTPCDPSMSMNGYYLVNVDSVELIGTIRPPVAFSECA